MHKSVYYLLAASCVSSFIPAPFLHLVQTALDSSAFSRRKLLTRFLKTLRQSTTGFALLGVHQLELRTSEIRGKLVNTTPLEGAG
ncbi:hypothetical protein T265_14487 [Opisthorchis viverrini]|uniref:Uncharacterized protein n=1 Tax=Opisthorchis viverrini TaxID=6198 RepID=A0A074ZEW3_OPIVI|nr:hypothetical protein T265_14487 [Opisthorchis viverrini]KER24157.1 hypothetical protein T265_14487 [Opisthorchis viverrini]